MISYLHKSVANTGIRSFAFCFLDGLQASFDDVEGIYGKGSRGSGNAAWQEWTPKYRLTLKILDSL